MKQSELWRGKAIYVAMRLDGEMAVTTIPDLEAVVLYMSPARCQQMIRMLQDEYDRGGWREDWEKIKA